MAQGLTPQEQEELRALLRQAFEEPEARTLLAVFERLVARRADIVTRQDFQDRQHLVAQLTEGQRALHEAMTRLTEAQIRTEERVGWLEEALGRLTEAQARTEERMSSLTEAQARTEQTLQQLTQAVQQLARQVGGLSKTVGGDIEDIAYIVLHDVLKREFSWEVGVLERTWQIWNGEPVELNIFGQAQDPTRPDRPIWIVGEAKHNLTLREVERFARQVTQAHRHLKEGVFAVCFCYRARPEVRARLQKLGIRLVFSYGRMV